MTDVRLTATNPADSSVVPVACNSRGELLITEPVIETIPNDVTIDGYVMQDIPSDFFSQNVPFWSVRNTPTNRIGYMGRMGGGGAEMAIVSGGHRGDQSTWVSYGAGGTGHAKAIYMGPDDTDIAFCVDYDKATGTSNALTVRFRINANGGTFEALRIAPLNQQKGITIDVGEELVFLRAQVKALMEKLKMVPEGGWPVWDGSD